MRTVPRSRRWPTPPAWADALGGAVAFVVAVQLLGHATTGFAADLDRLLRLYVDGPFPALGATWLASYVVNNGSVVAAVAVSLFDAGILTDAELYLMIAGTRLGGSSIVVLVGALDHVHRPETTVRRSIGMGLLTFLLALAVFVPAIPLGYLAVSRFPGGRALGAIDGSPLGIPSPLSPALDAVVGVIGWLSFPLALVLLFLALNGFHRAFDRMDPRALRERYLAYLNHRWMLLGLGALVTALTTSVAFSLGVVVPLYNRGTVTRREAIPYILGANVATLSDTLLVGVVLGSPVAVAAVTVLALAGTVVTLAALLWFEPFAATVESVLDGVVEDRIAFVALVAVLVVVPLALVLA